VKRLVALAEKEECFVAGLNSGTSADGIDVALVRCRGRGLGTAIETVHFATVPYPARTRDAILHAASGRVADLCRLDFTLGGLFADATEMVLAEAGRKVSELDLVGSHGQTIVHVARRTGDVASTLQIGEASVLAERLGAPVVSDFRSRDIAAGGEGAPLSAYLDYVLFRRDGPPRALLNLGGIANVTIVTPDIEQVFAFDTGPANMPLDETVRVLTQGEEHFDRDGERAAEGRVDENLLQRLLAHPYLDLPLPKTTGRETFGVDFVLPLLKGKGAQRGVDVLATLTAFAARSIRRAFDDFVFPRVTPAEIVVSGGGVHNLTLMGHLRRAFKGIAVRPLSDLGVDPDAKEAILFAFLAHETVCGLPNNLPGATGARWPTILGKVSP